jgi:putative ABC transport system permease protein
VTALLAHEVRSILASFRRRPLVPLIAAGMLALGIAANVAVFAVISRTLLRPLRYERPERLVVIGSTFVEPDKKEEVFSSGSIEIVQWKLRSSLFSAIDAVRPVAMSVRDGGDPESVPGAEVTGGVFRMLGVRPVLGRDFVREDDVPNARVAIISHGLWRRRFGGTAAVLGRSIVIDGRSISIIGVLPRDFEVIAATPQPELFRPSGFSAANMPTPGARSYTVFGRLRDGVTPKQGEAELRRISADLAREYPVSNQHWTATVKTLRDAAYGKRRQALIVLWLAVLLLHILACVNVASLLSAQIADERGITALRLVLGAARRHILRYRLIQTLLITTAGAIAGFLLGAFGLRLLLLRSADASLTTPAERGWVMPLFLIAISVVTAAVVAIVPALRETRTALTSALNEQGNRASSSVRGARLREMFIIGEVALAVPLLLAGTATIQRFRELQRVSLGFDPSHVLVSQLVMPAKYDKVTRSAFARELIRRVEAVPGVESAATTTCNFSPDGGVTTSASTDRFPEPISTNFRRITPRYFETMRIPLIAGRPFADTDTLKSPPVVIVSAGLARRFFPNQSPLGQRILRPPNPPATVIGVVPDVRDDGASTEPQPTIYTSYLQGNNVYLTLVVRTKTEPLAVRDGVRRAVWSLDRDLTPSREKALADLMSDAVGAESLQMTLLSAFGFIALTLATVGIYGMTSYAVAKRIRDIGVRLAFGATPRDVFLEVVRRALQSVSIGLAAGIALTLLAQRVASLVVYGAARFEPRAAAIVILLLFAAALIAACVPSFRARSAQPVLLLRDA